MSKKILIADDESDVVELIENALKLEGYDVLIADTGINALIQTIEQHPDLLLLDVRMPAGTGVGVYENILKRKELCQTPVIFITAFSTPELKERVLSMGAAGFVQKPFDTDLLVQMIQSCLATEPN